MKSSFKTGYIIGVIIFLTLSNFIFGQAPLSPTLNYPIDNDTLVSKKPYFVWTPNHTNSNDSFRIQITPDPTFYYIQYNLGSVDSIFLMPVDLSTGSPYYWRVRGVNGSGSGTWSAQDTFRVSNSGDSIPPLPYPGYPTGSLVVHTYSPTLSWYVLHNLNSCTFDIEINTTGIFTGTPTFTGVSGLTYALAGLLPNTTYYWKVRSLRFTRYSAWSSAATFSTVALPTAMVPVLSWPIDQNMVYSNNVTLYWYINGNSTGITYEGELNTTGTFTGTANFSTGASSFYNIILSYDSTYYWKIRSYNGSTYSAWTDADTFSTSQNYTLGGTPLVPTMTWPIGYPTIFTSSVNFAWYIDGSGTNISYQGELSTSGSFTGTPNFSSATTSYSTTLLYGTKYYWKIRSINTVTLVTSSWSAVDSFIVVGVGGSGTPIPSWPIGGATVWNTSATLNWYLNGPYGGISSYQVEMNTDNSFTGTPTYTGITNPYYTVSGLTEGVTYYWKVRAYDGVAYTSWSSAASFVIFTSLAPSRPMIGGPTNNNAVFVNSPMLSWFVNTQSPQMSYELEYATNSSFNNSTKVENISAKSKVVQNLVIGNKYYWRVRSRNSNNQYSSYSTVANFRVLNPTEVKENNNLKPETFEMSQNYPNPFNPSTKIKYQLPFKGNVTLKIFNLLGNEIKTLVNGQKEVGFYEVDFNSNNLASGIYFYRIDFNSAIGKNFSSIKKMIIIK